MDCGVGSKAADIPRRYWQTSWRRADHLFVQLLLATLCSCCFGQQAPGLSDLTLEQLTKVDVYTASGYLQRAKDAPSSVTVITAKDIQEFGYRTLADVLRTVRGFYVTYDRDYSTLGVRGFERPNDLNVRVLLLVNGHRMNDNVYEQAMIGTEFPVDVDLIQRIEVVRGPASSLYGSNAVFAVINIFTKKQADINGLEISSEAGSFNSYKGRISYGRRCQQLRFLISGSFYGSRGHNSLYYPEYDSPSTNYGIAHHDDDDQVGSAFLSATTHDLALYGSYGTREKGIPTGVYETLFDNPATRTVDSHGYIELRYDHQLNPSSGIMARAFVDKYDYLGTNARAGSASQPIDTELDFGDGKWWGTEIQYSHILRKMHHVIGGVEYRDNFQQDQKSYSLNPYQPLLDDRRQSYIGALYLQDEIALAKSLTITAGLRYDYYSTIHSDTDPRIAVIYEPRDMTSIKFLYGKAFRAPSVFESYYSVDPSVANATLRPETIQTMESVWEQTLTTNLSLSTSVFRSKMNDLISQVDMLLANGDDVLTNENVQRTVSNGIELQFSGQIPAGPTWKTSYGFQETKDADTHQFMTSSPRSLAKLNVSQAFFQRALVTSLDAQYRSGLESANGSGVSRYAIVNLTVLGRNVGRHADISASIYNLLDKRYADPTSAANLENEIPQDGRAFRAKMTWHWGNLD